MKHRRGLFLFVFIFTAIFIHFIGCNFDRIHGADKNSVRQNEAANSRIDNQPASDETGEAFPADQAAPPQEAPPAKSDKAKPGQPGAPTGKISLEPYGAQVYRVENCRVEEVTLQSEARQKETRYYAFVPDGAGAQASYPVLYLLHGAWDSHAIWKEKAEGAICKLVKKYGLIIITPDGEPFGWYADSDNRPDNQIETYFMKELIPHVEANFPTNGRRGMAGLSMGGHGALVLAMRGKLQFVSVSSMSGILDITKHKINWELPDVLGPYDKYKDNWEAHSAYHLAKKNKEFLAGLNMLITVSLKDKIAYNENEAFHRFLNEMGLNHYYQVSPGDHNWDYWLEQLPNHVAFHARFLH